MDPEEKKETNKKLEYKPYKKKTIKRICAIDFGSFGFAAAWCPVELPDMEHVVKSHEAEVSKNLAALLIDSDTKQVKAFGYEAEKQYAKLQESKDPKKRQECMFFQHFKPHLYKKLQSGEEKDNDKITKSNTSKNKTIKCEDGTQEMKLVELIKLSLEQIMKEALEEMNNLNQLAQQSLLDITNIFWVITVPAIWDEMSMELMKLCARRAGMIDFELGMEPIVSTFFALNTSKEEIKLTQGKKFIVLDCGGGTTDAACIRVEKNEELSELYHGDGILCGGLKVDQLFLSYIETIFPKQFIDDLKRTQSGHWIDLRQNFVKSRWFVPYNLQGKQFNVKLTFPFSKFYKKLEKEAKKNKSEAKKKKIKEYVDPLNDLKKKIENFRPDNYDKYVNIFKKYPKYKDIISKYNDINYEDDDDDGKIDDSKVTELGPLFQLTKGFLKVTQIGWDIMHFDVIHEITEFLKTLLKKPGVDTVKDIILVGGFAQSIYLKTYLQKQLGKKGKRFHSSNAPQLAVVKGALYWICQTSKLNKHRTKWTYGISIDKKFDVQTDDANRKETNENGIGMVRNAFQPLCEFNTALPDGHQEIFDFTIPANSDRIEIPIWVTKAKNKRYVYNEGNIPVIPVKKFFIEFDKSNKPRDFQLTFEYNHNGVKLGYKHPKTKETLYFMVKHEDIDILKEDFEENIATKIEE